jgi:hypothetical protein
MAAPAALNKLFPSAPVRDATPTIASLGLGAGKADAGASEIDAWKAERKKAFRLPWRQLSLVAGLSFGIGGLVLPDSVNSMTDPILYALMAMSFGVGIFGKGKPK